MKEAIIFVSDKKTEERLRVLINILFPEVDVSCVSECSGSSEESPVDLRD